MERRTFNKADIYARFPYGSWQDRWVSYLGPSLTFTVNEVVNFIYFPGNSPEVYVKYGDSFLRVGELSGDRIEFFAVEDLLGEGMYVGKALIPVSCEVVWDSKEGITGTEWQKVSKLHRSYVKEWVTEGWQSKKRRVFLKLNFQELSVYGEEWEELFERQRIREESIKRKKAIERAIAWCKREGLIVENEEILWLVGLSILEEEQEMYNLEERRELRLLGLGYDDDVYDFSQDYDVIFYEGPEKIAPCSFKIRKWLTFMMYGPREYPI